jgi:hypothetical protein
MWHYANTNMSIKFVTAIYKMVYETMLNYYLPCSLTFLPLYIVKHFTFVSYVMSNEECFSLLIDYTKSLTC